MSFKESLKKLKSSPQFREFKKKNKNTFLFASFFVLNSDMDAENQQFDYCIDAKKFKIMTFYVNDEIKNNSDKLVEREKTELKKLDENIKIDIDELVEIVKKEIGKKCSDISKTIIIMQIIDNIQVWNVIAMSSSFQLFKMYVDCFNGKILKSEEKNVMDFMNVRGKDK